jgi:hypothetical protein
MKEIEDRIDVIEAKNNLYESYIILNTDILNQLFNRIKKSEEEIKKLKGEFHGNKPE